MSIILILTAGLAAAGGELPSWAFDAPADQQAWIPNADLVNASFHDGVFHAEARGTDPFLSSRTMEFASTPWQYLLVRIKASRSGNAELFWSGSLDGEYGGLNQTKSTPFRIHGDGAWHEIAVFPFWQKEEAIRQLRFDVYDDAAFEIDWIKILTWQTSAEPISNVYAWSFTDNPAAWRIHPEVLQWFSPPLDLDVSGKGWATIRATAEDNAVGRLLWSTGESVGVHSQDFVIEKSSGLHSYNIELKGVAGWRNRIVALGLEFPPNARIGVESLTIAEGPTGPPDVRVAYWRFADGVNRAGRPRRVLAHLENRGGSSAENVFARLELPESLQLASGGAEQQAPTIPYNNYADLVWTVTAATASDYTVGLHVEGAGAPTSQTSVLHFAAPREIVKAEYVPEPKSVATALDVCAYYFPGWESDAKWDCIRRVAPIRKPLLGYYDEGNPECVDWQIKWAVENGVSCFLVDWYWTAGHQSLTHWMDAYRKAKYRDYLKIAIMWANHNPPDTHSRDDWRAVTQHWIDRYFNLPAYYTIDGKPAIFLWDPNNLKRDLRGSENVQATLNESQEMARAAGYAGITFVTMHANDSPALAEERFKEGYIAATSYHEWGRAGDLATDSKRLSYADVVKTAPEAWERRRGVSGSLAYFPVVDTGWDSRPWHGNNAMAIGGRSVDGFEKLLEEAKMYCVKSGQRIVVLGPVNEWGEGSYIEPNTEFGFDMYETVRKVFATGEPVTWPINIAPEDVGLGPYEFSSSSEGRSAVSDR